MTNHINQLSSFGKGVPSSKEKGLNAVVYTRVSTKKQLDNLSLETQLKGCNEFVKRYNYDVKSYFGGTYESAETDERKEFVRMVNFVKKSKEKICYIIVYSLERFSRTGDNAIWLSGQLRKLGVSILSVTQPIDTSNPAGVLQQNILFLFSQYDNELRKQKSIAGMKEKLEKGFWVSGIPLGYKLGPVENPKDQNIQFNNDAPLIKQAFKMKLHGSSNVQIAETITKKGLRLTESRLGEMLRNPFYCGYIAHSLLGGKIVPGRHPAIVSEEVFLQVNEILKDVSQGHKWKNENENLPMRKMIYCECCGSMLTGYNKDKVLKNGKVLHFHYYKCNTKSCKLNRSNKIMHDRFVEVLKRYQLNSDLIPVIRKQLEITLENLLNSNVSSSKSIKAKLADLKADLEEIEMRHATGKIGSQLFEKTSTKLEADIKKISAEMEKSTPNLSNPSDLVDKGIAFALELTNCWENGDFEERQMVQNILFPEGIIYNKENDEYRTSNANEVIRLIANLSATYEQEKRRQINDVIDLSPLVVPTGIEPVSKV